MFKLVLNTVIMTIIFSTSYLSNSSFGFDLGGALKSFGEELEKGVKELEQGLDNSNQNQQNCNETIDIFGESEMVCSPVENKQVQDRKNTEEEKPKKTRLTQQQMDVEYEKSEEAVKNKNWSLVKQIVQPLAKKGHAKSQSRFGALYINGLGVPKNVMEGIKWTTLAAEQGNSKAQSNLGVMYANGQGVPQDYKEAVKWFRLSADQGYADAKVALKELEKGLQEEGQTQQQSQQKEQQPTKQSQLVAAKGGCPSGYQVQKKYESTEVQMRWLGGGGEFSRCLNQSYPEKNNRRDSWGVSFGDAWYKCGDINVRGFLGNAQSLRVKPSNPKLNPVSFSNQRRSKLEPVRKAWCKKNGESVTCLSSVSHITEWSANNVPKTIESKYIMKVVHECAVVGF